MQGSATSLVIWQRHYVTQACKKKKEKRKRKRKREFNSLPFHHLLEQCPVRCRDSFLGGAVFCWSPYLRRHRVFVELLKYLVGRVYKNLPFSIGATLWSPGSFQLRPIIRQPILCPSGRRSVLTHLPACLGGLSLQQCIRYPQFCCLWGILLCQTYWQIVPLVVNLIGRASWLRERFCMQLGLGRCPGGLRQWPRWASGHFACFFVFKTWLSVFLENLVVNCLMEGCWW